jgi:hypothetical protein
MRAQTYQEMLDIADRYAHGSAEERIEQEREESAGKVWIGQKAKGSTPASRRDAAKADALARGDTKAYLALVLED